MKSEWIKAALQNFGGLGDAPVSTPEELSAEIKARLTRRIQEDRRRSWDGMLGKVALFPHPCGLSFWVLLGDSMSAGIIRSERDDSATTFLMSKLTAGGTFLDIGTNAGWFTLRAASRYRELGSGSVHGFEPQASLHSLAVRSLQTNGLENATVHNLALGDEDRDVFMADGGLNSGGSYVQFKGTAANEPTVMKRLDSLNLPIDRVDAIKIDIEGAEPMFFRGAEEFIRHHRPTIYSELHPRKLVSVSKTTREGYLDQVEALGYTVHGLNKNSTTSPFDRTILENNDRLINVVFIPTL